MVHNMHEREFPVKAESVGRLIDSLAHPVDRLWPGKSWPPMRLDKPLVVGARGGHGPIRYRVESYEPGERVRFRFEAPNGFHGFHEFAVIPTSEERTTLRHTLIMRVTGTARVTWPLLFRPLHDALIEDSLSKAASQLDVDAPDPLRWSPHVLLLRALTRRVA